MSADQHGPKSDRQAEQDSLSALQRPLSDCVRDSLEAYFKTLGDHDTTGLYQMVLREVEKPLLEAVLQHTDNNQSNAALVLSISRGTLRKKLKEYDL